MDFPYAITTESSQETQKVGQSFARFVVSPQNRIRIICTYGQLGSGKTTFIQGFARGMGYAGRLLSPTFVIMRLYDIKAFRLCHIDAYRLADRSSISALGLTEYLREEKTIVCIEWAQKLASDLPSHRFDIWFTKQNHTKHTIRLERV